MTGISDGSGTTAFRYDVHGRVAAKAQVVGTGPARTLEISYLPNGQTEGHVLPSGAVIRYTYRADGRLLTIRVNGVEIVRDVDCDSFGEPKSWSYGTSDRYERVFDQDGRIREHTAGAGRRGLGFDAASRIRSGADGLGGDPLRSAAFALDRLTATRGVALQNPVARLSLVWRYDASDSCMDVARGTATDRSSQLAIWPM